MTFPSARFVSNESQGGRTGDGGRGTADSRTSILSSTPPKVSPPPRGRGAFTSTHSTEVALQPNNEGGLSQGALEVRKTSELYKIVKCLNITDRFSATAPKKDPLRILRSRLRTRPESSGLQTNLLYPCLLERRRLPCMAKGYGYV